MMADEKNENTEATPEQAPGVPETPEVAKAKADSGVAEAETEHAVTKEEPAIADTPSEAADNQSPAQGAEGQPRERQGRGGRDNRGGGDRGGRGRGRGRDDRRGKREEEDDGIIEKLVHINRVSKTVKGGKQFAFTALTVVGDGEGRVGFGYGKAKEVPAAIAKTWAAGDGMKETSKIGPMVSSMQRDAASNVDSVYLGSQSLSSEYLTLVTQSLGAFLGFFQSSSLKTFEKARSLL